MKSSNATKIGHAVWVLAGLMLGGLFGKAGTSLAAEHTWVRKVDMPTARFLHSASVVDGKIYVIGGAAKDMTEAIFPVEVYDPVMDKWTTEANIPAPRVAHSASVVDGKIYAIGGAESPTVLRSTVLEYDPAEDTWTTKSDMPTARWFLSTSVVDGKIYAIGGASSLTSLVGLSTVEVYDPVTDTWTTKEDMPFGVWYLCTAVVDGKIYALGGRPGWTAIPYVQEYDPATDTWAQKSDMPVGTSGMGSVVLGDKIIVIGGWLSSLNTPYTAVQMYDPETDIWTIEGDAPFLRAAFSASVVNNRIYAIGGTDRPHPCPATSTVYELTVSGPPPDFNGDRKADFKDFCRLAQYLFQDELSVDIAPPPFGDHLVDLRDVAVLSEYWLRDLRLVAHWALDESEGDIAHDSAGDNDGFVNGEAVWLSAGGRIGGVLQFDGSNDYVQTHFVLDPADGPFSAFAWIKGGAAGQAIVSQAAGTGVGSSWLCADPCDGQFMTELKAVDKFGEPLVSDLVVTGGDWYHVGLVWDGSRRRLYVDGEEAARDSKPQADLEGSDGGLYFGAASTLDANSYWSGLIDDIRIYDEALAADEVSALVNVPSADGTSGVTLERAEEVQEEYTEELFEIEGVVGTAVGYSKDYEVVVKVFVVDANVTSIPDKLDEVGAETLVAGEFYAGPSPEGAVSSDGDGALSRTGRFDRPVPIGVSTGHIDVTAGTIGCRVKDEAGNVYALSNNHVYANSNYATLGDNVLQPGVYDGGEDPNDAIGTLYDFEPLDFTVVQMNTMDAAIALSSTGLLGNATPVDGYGKPRSKTAVARLHQKVQKYGRTTGLTAGEIDAVNAIVRVFYHNPAYDPNDPGSLPFRVARFSDQIIIVPGSDFVQPGDSGSLVVTRAKKPVGLLFAGSSTYGVANRIDLVLERFAVTVDDE